MSLCRCPRCDAIVRQGQEFRDHMDYHAKKDAEDSLKRDGELWRAIKNAVAGNVGLQNVIREFRHRAFQMQGAYDGAMSEDCKALYAAEYEILSRLLED